MAVILALQAFKKFREQVYRKILTKYINKSQPLKTDDTQQLSNNSQNLEKSPNSNNKSKQKPKQNSSGNNSKIQKSELYEITPKGWLKSEDKCSKLLFQKGIQKEEFMKIHSRILGKNSQLENLKVVEVSEITRKDEEGGELLNLGSDFHHMYLVLQLEETIYPQQKSQKSKNKFQTNKQKAQTQENPEIQTQEQQEQQTSKRIVWFRLEYLRQSQMQFFYSLKFRRIPQDFGKLLRIRRFLPKQEISLQNVLEEVENYQNQQEFDPWEHNCQRFIKTIKSLIDVQEI